MNTPEERDDEDSLIQQNGEEVENKKRELQVANIVWHVIWVERRHASPLGVGRPTGALSVGGEVVIKSDGEHCRPQCNEEQVQKTVKQQSALKDEDKKQDGSRVGHLDTDRRNTNRRSKVFEEEGYQYDQQRAGCGSLNAYLPPKMCRILNGPMTRMRTVLTPNRPSKSALV